MGLLDMLHSLSAGIWGPRCTSTESINVLFCLFVCPRSLRKPQGKNQNGGKKKSNAGEDDVEEQTAAQVNKDAA